MSYDNPPTKGNLLVTLIKEKLWAHKNLRAIADHKGKVYCFHLAGPEQRFFLVSRGTEPYLYQGYEIVSVNKAVWYLAKMYRNPIVMAMHAPDGSLLEYRVIHPDKTTIIFENDRFGSVMCNFDYKESKSIKYPAEIAPIWREWR